ncbi:MAG TPA: hypothetical protein VFU73_03165 [Actinocrinis sp.]|nr:hypothetical protein [Actinocrinis sp.]
MMASIRLFGRGKSAAGASGGTAVSAAQIAELLAGLQTASMSTTWRCRHGSGTAIGEGAVDFETRRSRSMVIRNKSAFEYVRVGSSVYRSPVEDDDVRTQLGGGKNTAAAAARGSAARVVSAVGDEADDADVEDDDDEVFEDDAEDGAEAELDLEEEFDDPEGGTDPEAEADSDELTDADVDGVDAQEATATTADDEQTEADEDEKDDDAPARAWQTFSEHDACGVHAYAEPSVLAAGVRAAGAVTAAGRQEFDGRMLSGYAVTLKPKPGDPDRVLARLARQLRDHGANTLVVTAFVDESESAGAAAEAVPDFSGVSDTASETDSGEGARIVRLRLELAHWTPADDPTADHSVTVDLFEFGDPVEVQVPGNGTSRRTMRSCADLALF